jgi:hypothetical protein
MNTLPLVLASLLVLSGIGVAGPVIKAKDKSGREMEIELISLLGDRISFMRTSDGKTFDLLLSTFDADTVKAIEAKKGELAPAHPNYGLDVVIEKRRKDRGNSYYMEEQTVSAKVTIKNPINFPAPALSVRVLFFGQSRRTKTNAVLAVRDYSVKLGPGLSDGRKLDPFVTVYDSDGKGYGNVGGDQYTGYLLLMMDEKGNVIRHQSTLGKLNEIFRTDPGARVPFKTMRAFTRLTDKFEVSGEHPTIYSGSTN